MLEALLASDLFLCVVQFLQDMLRMHVALEPQVPQGPYAQKGSSSRQIVNIKGRQIKNEIEEPPGERLSKLIFQETVILEAIIKQLERAGMLLRIDIQNDLTEIQPYQSNYVVVSQTETLNNLGCDKLDFREDLSDLINCLVLVIAYFFSC